MALRIIDLQGTSYDGGVQHGRAAADLIRRNLAIYYDRFQRETRLPPQEVRDRAMRYLPVIDTRDREYGQAMRGVSEGANLPLADIAVLNARYEILYSQYSMINQGEEASLMVDGCTAFAVTPDASADGHLYLGQNWDWFPQVEGVIVRTRRPDGFALAAFTEAGIVGGKIGMNTRGIGLVINGLLSNKDDWRRLRTPFHVRTWQVLQAQTLHDAARIITTESRSCSANFLLGQADGAAQVMNIEAAPDAVCTLQPRDGVLAHANHFENPDALEIWQPLAEDRSTTYQRAARMHELLKTAKAAGKLGTVGLQEILRDHRGHPDSVCRHPNPRLPEEQRVETVVSVLEDLTVRKFYVAGGTPCATPFKEIPLT